MARPGALRRHNEHAAIMRVERLLSYESYFCNGHGPVSRGQAADCLLSLEPVWELVRLPYTETVCGKQAPPAPSRTQTLGDGLGGPI